MGVIWAPVGLIMKKFLGVLVLILFTLQTPSWADDIRDFQIEGMSVGDSLLDYFSENEIKHNIIGDYYEGSDKKFIAVEFILPSFNIYEGVQIHVKRNDKKYKIYGISGGIFYDDNIDGCYKKQNEIDKELSIIYKNAKREVSDLVKHPADKSGKSTVKYIVYWFKSGDLASIDCYDWSNKMKPNEDNLQITLDTKELNDWLHSDIIDW